jgi:Cys-tRNA(Pro)/Cys-tRNA(Cys) deacylase
MVDIEELAPDDWSRWRDLRLAALADAPRAFGAQLADWADASEERWRDRLAFNGAANFVASVDDEPAGMASGIRSDIAGRAEIISMWVAPSARGRGVGDALIEAVRAWASDQGLELLQLDVVVTNDRALGLYRRHGFAVVGDAETERHEAPELRMLTTTDPDQVDRSAIVLAAAEGLGLPHTVTRHGPVRSLAEAAAARGVQPSAIVKTMVVRVSDDDHRFVLVPGDREIDWAKLRPLLGVNRISMPDADVARRVTGFVRGTITPLGSVTPLPVVADERVRGTISLGGGAHGTALTVEAEDLLRVLDATVADVTK